jgi:hypothetical protein
MNNKQIIFIALASLLMGICITSAVWASLHKPKDDYPYQRALDRYDSVVEVNASLEASRTIAIQEANQLKYSIDSLKSIRHENTNTTNNGVTQLHNASTAGKLIIIDSILRARKKGQR